MEAGPLGWRPQRSAILRELVASVVTRDVSLSENLTFPNYLIIAASIRMPFTNLGGFDLNDYAKVHSFFQNSIFIDRIRCLIICSSLPSTPPPPLFAPASFAAVRLTAPAAISRPDPLMAYDKHLRERCRYLKNAAALKLATGPYKVTSRVRTSTYCPFALYSARLLFTVVFSLPVAS
jgi:hypothetical protein